MTDQDGSGPQRGKGLLVLSGPPCSGKSTVGGLLTSSFPHRPRRIHLEVDSLLSLLLPRSDRSRDDRMLAYDAAHAVARRLLCRGESVVLECTYARTEQRRSLVDALAELTTVPVRVIELTVTGDTAVQRFRQRDQATDLDDELVRERVEAFPPFDQALRLASAVPTDALAQRIDEWWWNDPASVDLDAWARAGRGWD